MIQVPDEDTVIVDGATYKASPEIMGCKLCAFDLDVTEACLAAPCVAEKRLEGRDVIFIKEVPCVS